MLLGEHTLELAGVDTETIYETYCNKLEESIRAMIDDEFHERFTRYVEFNADALPFRGIELADYLAKTSNASGNVDASPEVATNLLHLTGCSTTSSDSTR